MFYLGQREERKQMLQYAKTLINPEEANSRHPNDSRADITLGKMRSRQILPNSPYYSKKIVRFDPQYIHAPCYLDYTISSTSENYSADTGLGESVSSGLVTTWRTISAQITMKETASEYYASGMMHCLYSHDSTLDFDAAVNHPIAKHSKM